MTARRSKFTKLALLAAAVVALAATLGVYLSRTAGGVGAAFEMASLRSEEVNIDNPAAAVKLSGTLTLPSGAGPFPAIVLIPGSGEVTRNGELFGHKFYLVLAEHLTRQGFAVLRSDKRGLGKSTGDFAAATSADFATDIAAAVAVLRRRGDIDPARVGLIGHSEGGLIGPMVASKDPAIAFVVMMAGNGVRGDHMLLGRARRAMLLGSDPRTGSRDLALREKVFAVLSSSAPAPQREAAARQLFIDAQRDDGRTFSEDELRPLLTPWMHAFLSTDPAPYLQQIQVPVLALLGEKDQVVVADDNAPSLEAALAHNSSAKVQRLPGKNHFFQTARTGDFSEVAGISETISPDVLALISDWLAPFRSRPTQADAPR